MPRKMALIDYNRCRPDDCSGGLCVAVSACPHQLLRQEAPYEAPLPDPAICQGCGKCIAVCPLQAIRLN